MVVHDSEPNRVEVRFHGNDIEWRIRVDLENGQLTSEVTARG